MTTPTFIPIMGSVTGGDLSKDATAAAVTVVTTTGHVVSFSNKDLEAAHVVQAAQDPSQSLYRLFLSPDAMLSVKMTASAWAEVTAANDALRASLASSGASKRIEDTA